MSQGMNGTLASPVANPFGTPSRMILLGYYDGPTEGVIQFENGLVFHFVMPDEENQLARQWFPREYIFQPMPSDALDRLKDVLAGNLTPNGPCWYVNWQFDMPEIERDMDARVQAILAEAGPPIWSVTASDHWSFKDFRPSRVVPIQPSPL